MPELTGNLISPYSLVDRETGAILYTTEDKEDLIAHWREDQSSRILNARGEELGLISAASRRRS